MENKLIKSWGIILITIVPLLFSCASTQQKQSESRDAEFYKDRKVTSDTKGQTEVKSKDVTLLEDYRVIQRIKIPTKYLLSPGDFFRCLTLSPDGKKLAYIWKGVSIGRGSCSAWIDDNKVSPDFDFIWEGISLCSDGSKVAYSAPGSSNNMFVWVNNNKISPEFRHTLDVAFSPDCSRVAYRAITHRDYDSNKAWGKNSIWINSTRVSPEGSAAYSGKPVFSPDGSKVAYAVKIDKKSSVWINDKRVSPEFDGEISQHQLIFSPDGSRVAYSVMHDKFSIWINDKRQFNNAGGLVFSPDGSKVAYYSYEKKSVYIDDKKVSPELGFSHGLVFSPDGSKLAYYVYEGKKKSVWINDKKVSPDFSADLIWDLVFSPDSSSVAYRLDYFGKHECIWINDKKLSPDLRWIKFAKEHFSKTGEVIFAGLNVDKQEILHAATVEHAIPDSVTGPTKRYFGEVTSIDITEYGIYKAEVVKSEASPSGVGAAQTLASATLIEQTEKIPATPGTRFGFRYTINGFPNGEKVDVTFKVISPVIKRPKDNKEFSVQEFVFQNKTIGYNTYCDYGFGGGTWGMVPGEWRLQLFHNEKKLAEKIFYIYKP